MRRNAMSLARIAGSLSAALITAGCAGSINAWKNDPLQSYTVDKPSIYTMTGDRRTAVFNLQSSPLKYCAESMPDAVAAVAASSNASARAPNGSGLGEVAVGVSDTTAVGLLQTFQRTEIAELSRQLGWSTCLAWAQGAITDAQYHAILQQMVTGIVDVMKTRAGQAQVIQVVPNGSLVVSAKNKNEEAPRPVPTSTAPARSD